jgi:ATP-dependent Clp protease ATP-binding subunit ClpC
MFENFTQRGRQVFVFADEEARRLNHAYIGTEHFLLGLIRVEEGLAARVLGSFGVELDRVRVTVAWIVGLGDEEVAVSELPLTPRMQTIIELAETYAHAAGSRKVGTAHLLLGLAREGNGVANLILSDDGASSEDIRDRVVDFISGQHQSPQ